MSLLISIIIPTYNRAHLIGETLDSIIAQTYTNWECIVVDDGSTDHTDELLGFYTHKDPRISYHKRPGTVIKGGNSCRNYGFNLSRGDYIQWFDSDDIMLPESLEIKLKAILECKCDFVVAKLENFSATKGTMEQYYNRADENIHFEDYLFRKINWITPDPLISKMILKKYDLLFNIFLGSDQEYNYYSRLLSKTTNGVYLEKVLTQRRIHASSIQRGIDRSSRQYPKELFKNRYYTYLDLKNEISINIEQAYLNQIMTIYFMAVGRKIFIQPKQFFKIIYKKKGGDRLLVYILALVLKLIFGKGYALLQFSKAKNKIN